MAKKRKLPEAFRVAIFGSARIGRSGPAYKVVFDLARRIARHNIDIVTGGGPGLMDAASRGHHAGRFQNHVHAIGLTIKLPHEERPSYHLDFREKFVNFSTRLHEFMTLADAIVVAPGGVGTLLEFLYSWQLIQVGHIRPIPIIMIGSMWPAIIKWVKQYPLRWGLMSPEDLSCIHLVRSTKHAMEIIEEHHRMYLRENGKPACTVDHDATYAHRRKKHGKKRMNKQMK